MVRECCRFATLLRRPLRASTSDFDNLALLSTKMDNALVQTLNRRFFNSTRSSKMMQNSLMAGLRLKPQRTIRYNTHPTETRRVPRVGPRNLAKGKGKAIRRRRKLWQRLKSALLQRLRPTPEVTVRVNHLPRVMLRAQPPSNKLSGRDHLQCRRWRLWRRILRGILHLLLTRSWNRFLIPMAHLANLAILDCTMLPNQCRFP